MPRGRSKSRTPTKRTTTATKDEDSAETANVVASKKTESNISRTIVDEDASSPPPSSSSSAKRRRTRSSSTGGGDALTSTAVPVVREVDMDVDSDMNDTEDQTSAYSATTHAVRTSPRRRANSTSSTALPVAKALTAASPSVSAAVSATKKSPKRKTTPVPAASASLSSPSSKRKLNVKDNTKLSPLVSSIKKEPKLKRDALMDVSEATQDNMNSEVSTKSFKSPTTSPDKTNDINNKNKDIVPPSNTTMDVKVHRVRHMEYMPSAVLAMTSIANGPASAYVALSRQDGSIEIQEATSILEQVYRRTWTPHLFPLGVIAGSKRIVAHSLAFVNVPGYNNYNNANENHKATSVNEKHNHRHHITAIPALVGASPDGTLWTIQFAGTPRQLQSRITSGGGGIFDLTTCQFPFRNSNMSSNDDASSSSSSLPLVAAACEDGSVRIWQLVDDDRHDMPAVRLQEPPVATLTTAGAPILSIAWRCVKQQQQASNHDINNKGTSVTMFDTEIYAGVADGTIRQYRLDLEQYVHSSIDDPSSPSSSTTTFKVRQQQTRMRMTVESRGRRTPTKVWTMQALEDSTLVTGNSLGQVQIWDTVSGIMIQSIDQTELKADVLKLVVTPSQTKLFASGVDARVLCLERSSPTEPTWKFTTALRPHTHDVKCMTVVQGTSGPCQGKNKDLSALEALITAGVDTKLCTYVVSDFAKRRPQVYYPWPSQSPVSSTQNGSDNGTPSGSKASSRHLVSMQRNNHLELYRLLSCDDTSIIKKTVGTSSTSDLIGEIAIEGASNLSISSLSPNGKWLAAANAMRLFVFRSQAAGSSSGKDDMDDNKDEMKPEKVDLPKPLDRITVVAMHFCGNMLFVADATYTLYAIDLTNKSEELTILSTFTIPQRFNTLDDKPVELLPISSIRSSPDGKFLVVMTKATNNCIQVFQRHLRGDEISYRYYWTIPNLAGARPAAMTILGTMQLAVATLSFRVYIFDLVEQKLTTWSEKRGFPIEKWPQDLSNRKDFPVRILENPGNSNQLIMASYGAFVVMNLTGNLPKTCRMIPEIHVRGRRKRGRDEDSPTDIASSNDKRAQPHIFSTPEQPRQTFAYHESKNSKNCTVCLHYNSMLHFDFLNSKEMVVVEQPWLRVIANFPEALQRRVYGFH